MNCHDVSDKMPAVVRGDIDWTDAEAAHLAACGECRKEWEIVAAGRAMASDVSIDADALSDRVIQRLRAEPVVRSFHRPRWIVGIAAAAAAVILLLSRSVGPAPLPRGPAAPSQAPLSVHLSGLGELGTAELANVLESFDTPWTETSTTDAPSLDDLDSQELERVQGSLEI